MGSNSGKSTMRIPLASPEITEIDTQVVTRVLGTPWQSQGPLLQEFEQSVAQYAESPHAIAVNSGTSALHLCICALRIGEGDEVIVPSFTFIAAANAVRYQRAVPIFVDIEPVNLNLDPSRIEEAITSRTRAIIVPHTFGCPAELPAILELARRHHLFVIEDACEAIGAECDGKKAGTLGDAGVFAFYPNKQITTGEGGVIITANAEIARSARSLRNQGRNGSDAWFEHFELGYSYRIAEINCALGNEQLKRIEPILARREHIARLYSERLRNNSDVTLPQLTVPNRRISWFSYVVRIGSQLNRNHRDWIRSEMIARGIGCGRYFAPIHLQPIYRKSCTKQTLPVTESVADRCLALPFFNNLSEQQIDEVCEILAMLLGRAQSTEHWELGFARNG